MTTLQKNEIVELIRSDWETQNAVKMLAPTLGAKVSVEQASEMMPKTDLYAANYIETLLGNHLAYVPTTDTWYAWNGYIHQPMDSNAIAQDVVVLFHEVYSEALSSVHAQMVDSGSESITESEKRYAAKFKPHRALRDRMASSEGMSAIARILRNRLEVSADHFRADGDYLVFQNGVLDTRAIQEGREDAYSLLPHDPSRAVWRMVNVDYRPGAVSEALDHFLHTSIADQPQARFLQKALGMAMCGEVTRRRSKVVLDIWGAPNSGKSMLFDVLDQLAGDYLASPSASAMVVGDRSRQAFERYPMVDARISYTTEIEGRLDKEFLKAYSGGDPFGVDIKGKTVKGRYKATGILAFVGNKASDVDLTDSAMRDRMAPVSFPYSFTPEDPEHPEDVTLKSRLVDQGEGIMAWLVEGYRLYLAEGMDRPDSMIALLSDAESDGDLFADWWDQRLGSGVYSLNANVPSRKCVTLSQAFADYLRWSEATAKGEPILTRVEFKKRFGQLGIKTVRADGTRLAGVDPKTHNAVI